MTTAEKNALAKSNNYFNLFREGLFYKCYNEDAMVFVKNVKEYKVSGKFIKSVGMVLALLWYVAYSFFKTRRGVKRIALNDRLPNL